LVEKKVKYKDPGFWLVNILIALFGFLDVRILLYMVYIERAVSWSHGWLSFGIIAITMIISYIIILMEVVDIWPDKVPKAISVSAMQKT